MSEYEQRHRGPVVQRRGERASAGADDTASTGGRGRWRALLGAALFIGITYAVSERFTTDDRPRVPPPSATPAAPAQDTSRSVMPRADDLSVEAAPPPRAVTSGPLEVDDRPCLPLAWRAGTATLEKPAAARWRTLDAGAVMLREDACGNLWALWYNTWRVFAAGDPERSASFSLASLPGLPEDARRQGVQDFLFAPDGAMWLMLRDSRVFRGDRDGWRGRRGAIGTGGGGLVWHAGTAWMTRPPAQPIGIMNWNPDIEGWHPVTLPRVRGFDRLASTPAGTLLAAGTGGVFESVGEGRFFHSWRQRHGPLGEVLDLGVADGRLWVASVDGLRIIEADDSVQHLFAGERVEAVLPRPGGRAWVAIRNAGLAWYDGAEWHRWRYAGGLPADDAQALALSADGRLWLGGSPLAVIDIEAAERQVLALKTPPSLPGERFADACAAAAALLGEKVSSGTVARASVDGQRLVFFDGQQVCPNPRAGGIDQPRYTRRESDGALLRVPVNGTRGHISCGRPCQTQAQARLAASWTMTLLLPDGAAPDAPLRRVELAPPDSLPGTSPSASLLVDARDHVWVGGRGEGVWEHDGERWRLHGEEAGLAPENRVLDLRSGPHGEVWVASSPTYLPERKAYAGANLHRHEAGGWQHWSPEQGLAYWSASAVQPLSDGAVVATNGGLSVLENGTVTSFDGTVLQGRTGVVAMTRDVAADLLWLVHGVGHPGVGAFDGAGLRVLSSREGLFADDLYAVAVDDQDRIWLQSDSGEVAVYERQVLLQDPRR